MKIVRKSNGQSTDVTEKPLEIYYEVKRSKPFDTLKMKFAADPQFKNGDYLSCVSDNRIVWSGRVTKRSVLKRNGMTEYFISSCSDGFELARCEAAPAVYEKPTFRDIVALRVSPHGIKSCESLTQCGGEFTVKSGMSEWDVVENFCGDVMGTVPYIDGGGVLRSGEILPDKYVNFSGIISLQLITNSEEAVKTVFYKPNKASDYRYSIEQDSERGVCGSVRFENLSSLPNWQGQSRLKRILKESLRRTEVLKVSTSELPADWDIGYKAKFEDFGGTYRIESLEFSKKGGQTMCNWTLLPEDIW